MRYLVNINEPRCLTVKNKNFIQTVFKYPAKACRPALQAATLDDAPHFIGYQLYGFLLEIGVFTFPVADSNNQNNLAIIDNRYANQAF